MRLLNSIGRRLGRLSLGLVPVWVALTALATVGAEPTIIPVESRAECDVQTFDLTLLGQEPVQCPLLGPAPQIVANGCGDKIGFVVIGQQTGFRIEQPVFVGPETSIRWTWKKDQGRVCIVQIGLLNPDTNQTRYFGYAAGALSEPPSGDPTVEVFVDDKLPAQCSRVERNVYQDIRNVLGWEAARITSFYLSPWDGHPGVFSDAVVSGARKEQPDTSSWQHASRIGRGDYVPLKLADHSAKHIDRFDTSFEECAPTRNSGANEWSAFGAIGDRDFNAMGRDLRVRYPLFDLVFRIKDGGSEIKPDTLDSFRLGLVNNRMPAIWGGWRYGPLLYKVSVMTVPDPDNGHFDLYKLQIQNPTDRPNHSKLIAGFDGPPDMVCTDGLMTGSGGAPFAVVDAPSRQTLITRDYGLCDKRAKSARTGPGPGQTEDAVSRFRIGLDGVPVVYRFKSDPDRRYKVYLAATPHIGGYLLENPKQPGDLVCEYEVEGCPAQRLDYVAYLQDQPQPLCVGFNDAHDVDGDGQIEVRAGVTDNSRIRHTRLSVIYVFDEDTQVPDLASVYSGSLNDKCIRHIDVGITPEQDWSNQHYDKSDVGLARLGLTYDEEIPPGEIRTYWLKIPPIHRREPVSMGYIAHAFRDVLPNEAVPPFSANQVAMLKAVDPVAAEQHTVDAWNEFFSRAARLDLPDPVLNDIYLSRLATRAIMNVKITDDVIYNTCSPFFYFDHAYRDHAYVVFAYDLAGVHDEAELLLKAYCKDVEDITAKGPISFDGKPLQLGMHENGLWHTRPGQWDTQGQNIWALVQHYKLSGRREWLEAVAYPYIRRGAMWLVDSRHKHKKEISDPDHPAYGLLEPGAMEVLEVGGGVHMYYLNGFGVLGLREAADCARALGLAQDEELFTRESRDLQQCLLRSFRQTFKRTGLYEGHLWFGVEPQGVGMYGFWAHNCLLWPCRCIDPHDPLLTATLAKMEMFSRTCGGGMHSEGSPGGYWPYIGVDRAVGYILRGEPDKTLDYFCAYTDTAGGTFSWGEGYSNLIAGGDQPHLWADAQYVNLLRHLFVMEDASSLMITPALFRRWHAGTRPIGVQGLATHFGDLDMTITPCDDGSRIDYRIRLTSQGDQASRSLDKLVVYPRTVNGRAVSRVLLDNVPIDSFTADRIIVPEPARNRDIVLSVHVRPSF